MKRRSSEASQRQLRVGEELRHALADVFGRGILRDPAIVDRSITVTEVRPSPDLRNATAFVIPLGGGDSIDLLEALRRCAPFLTREVSKRVHLKFAPRLNFVLDDSFDRVDKIDSILRSPEVTRDLRVEGGDQPLPDKDQESGTV
ncbi:MAG: 30S ribosome-binding factor RbfA [Alphaproteobacteria bacterium]|nr:30S ribosome-binding factor RbfA [Alphaproteobacteria bacterium]